MKNKVFKKVGIRIEKKQAQALHSFLIQHGLLDSKAVPKRDFNEIIFPLLSFPSDPEKKELKKRFPTAKTVSVSFLQKSEKKGSLKDALRSVLSDAELQKLVSGFDALGNIAIIEIPKELEKKQRQIAQAVLETNAGIQTVCKKTGAHKGKYRIEPVKIIAGKKNLVADYKESGCRFRIHLGKTFFSPRLSFERLRIAKQIKKGEEIGAFFAGVGPFPIVFAKHSPMKHAVAIELNPNSVKDLRYNIQLNKFENKIDAVRGDVKKIVPKKFKGSFDRVVMPLPKGAEDFLKEALVSLKPSGGIVHFYAFVPAENPFEAIEKRVQKTAQKNGFVVRFLNRKQVRTFSKDSIQIVIDFWVQKQKRDIC
jgi:tRNA (guanine37-N1)-methyltransferase